MISQYEALRLGIQNYVDYISKYNPARVERIEERPGNEALIGKSISEGTMLRIGRVAVPLFNFRFLRRFGSKANASFVETRSYGGHARRIWLPGDYYDRFDPPLIAATDSESLSEAWRELSHAPFDPVEHSGDNDRSLHLLSEAEGIAKDVGASALKMDSQAVILFPTLDKPS